MVNQDESHSRDHTHFPQMKSTLNKYIELLMLGTTTGFVRRRYGCEFKLRSGRKIEEAIVAAIFR